MGLAYDAIFIITRNDAIECTAQNVKASNEECHSVCEPAVGCGVVVVVVAGGAAGTQPSPGVRSSRTATRTQPRLSIMVVVSVMTVSVRLFIGAGDTCATDCR